MKKAKNQVPETKPSENKNRTAGTETEPPKVPSDKIRTKDGEAAELSFRKVLYGYDPDEVDSYIEEMLKTNSAAVRNYESRLSATKEELLLSNRERDSYCERLRKFSANSETAPGKAFAETEREGDALAEEYREQIINLQKKLEKSEEENLGLSEKVQILEKKNRQYGELEQRQSELLAQLKEAAAKLEFSQAQLDALQKKLSLLEEELKEKMLELAQEQARNEEAAKLAADFEIKNDVLNKRLEEKEAELETLREINKTQAYEYADKISRLESEHSQSRLAMQKEMQLREYYVNRAQLTLAELNRQMEQMKQPFGDAHSV